MRKTRSKSPPSPGTQTNYESDEGLSFAPVALRGGEIFRTPAGIGPRPLPSRARQAAAIARRVSFDRPAGTRRRPRIVSGLDGAIHVVPLDTQAEARARKRYCARSFKTPFGRPITVARRRFATAASTSAAKTAISTCLGPNGNAAPPTKELDSGSHPDCPLNSRPTPNKTGSPASATSPTRTAPTRTSRRRSPCGWIRRVEGTIKHASVHGGGRMYTHTAEGQIMAVEARNRPPPLANVLSRRPRLLHRPIYHDEKLLVPQAGFDQRPYSLSRRGDRPAHLGNAVHRLAKLEPPASTDRS